MRRIALLFTLSILYILPARAQQFKVGLLGGVNITDVDGVDPVDADNDFHKFGFTVGGLVGVHLSERTMLRMEIAYSQKGSSLPPDTTQANFNNNLYYTLRLNYIDVDVLFHHMIHLNLSHKPTDKFGIEGGISAGYMFKYFYSVQSINYTIPQLKTTDLSLFAGFSYNILPNFSIDLRYYNSILSIFNTTAVNTQWLYYSSWNRGHNLDFQITFKITFGSDASAPGNTPAPISAPPPQN